MAVSVSIADGHRWQIDVGSGKRRTEKALLELFPKSYMFRIGPLRAMHGEISKTRWTRILYSVSRPLWPLFQAVAPGTMITTEELGRAMIR